MREEREIGESEIERGEREEREEREKRERE